MNKIIFKHLGAIFLALFIWLDLFSIVIFSGDMLPQQIDNYFLDIFISPSILLSSPLYIILITAIISATAILFYRIVNPKILILFNWFGITCIILLFSAYFITRLIPL